MKTTLDRLAGGQVAGQPHLAGGAEGTGHAAAGLGGHAQGGAVLVTHEDGLHPHAVVQLPQVLDGAPAVGAQRTDLVDEVRQELGRQLLALGGGQVGHVLGVTGETGEVVARELVGSEGGQAGVLEDRLATGQIEVGQVARGLALGNGDREGQPRLGVR